MLRYRVMGANRETGTEVSASIVAMDQETAEGIARKRGILVSSVRLEGGQSSDADEPVRLPFKKEISPTILTNVSFGAAVKLGFGVGIGLLLVAVIVAAIRAALMIATTAGR